MGAASCRDIRLMSDWQKTQAGCLCYYLEPILWANPLPDVWRSAQPGAIIPHAKRFAPPRAGVRSSFTFQFEREAYERSDYYRWRIRIGKSVALALAKEGYAVFLPAGVRKLDATAEEISSGGGQALAVATDVSDAGSVDNLFARTVEAFERVDVLFNNAGTFGPAALLEDIDPDDWRAVVEVNLTGPFLCTQAAFRVMKNQDPQGGRIINNGSISSQTPRPNSAPYTATKHAITGLTKSTALDGRKYDIACGQIDIGNATTDMTSKMKQGVLQADLSKKVEPTMSVDNVANAVVYMASLPLDANVLSITVMTTKMPFVGRGYAIAKKMETFVFPNTIKFGSGSVSALPEALAD